jgi:hypothetical protein
MDEAQYTVILQQRGQMMLKGQSHEKVGEIRPWDVSLGSNYESLL